MDCGFGFFKMPPQRFSSNLYLMVGRGMRRRLIAAAIIPIMILSIALGALPALASAANFNPPNNAVKNGDFSKPELKVTNSTPLQTYGEWYLLAFNPQYVAYRFTVTDEKSCLVIDTRNCTTNVFLAQGLYNVRVNATTRLHFSVKFLFADDPRRAVSVQFGVFSNTPPDTAEGRTNIGTIKGWAIYRLEAGSDRSNWRTVDNNLVDAVLLSSGENVTGWYFACAALEDVSLSIDPGLVVAITDIAVYDPEGAPQTPQTLQAPFSLTVDCGSPVQVGEEASFFILSTVNGTPADADSLSLTLVKPDASMAPLQATRLSTGLYYAVFRADSVGTYALLVYGEKAGVKASALKCVEVEGLDAEIAARLDALNASVTAVHEGIVTVNTSLGELKASLSALGANVTQLIIESENRTVVQIQTIIGPINAKVMEIRDDVATILIPGLGEVKAAVVKLGGARPGADPIALAAAVLSAVAACASIICLLKRRKAERTEVKGKKAAEGGLS
ncbi:MAG: hypothetical protein QW701_07100 [Candidatus Nezhaarchaeales archaeon]